MYTFFFSRIKRGAVALHLCVSVCLRVSLFVAVFMYVYICLYNICTYMQAGSIAHDLAKDDATLEAFKCEALKCERTFEAHR